MTKTIKRFELNEKARRFTEPKECKRLCFVIQNTKQVKQVFTGLEPFAFMYLWKNLTKRNLYLFLMMKTKNF